MIVFELKCAKGHSFEEWFDSSADYEAKAKTKSIGCPQCGDKNVTKALMAPNISTSSNAKAPKTACAMGSDCGDMACPMANRF